MDFYGHIENNNIRQLEKLINKSPNQLTSSNYDQGLLIAASNGNPKIVQLMLNKATSWDKALCKASKRGYLDIVMMIVRKFVRIGSNDIYLIPLLDLPLHYAAVAGHKDIIYYLIVAGANHISLMYREDIDTDIKQYIKSLL